MRFFASTTLVLALTAPAVAFAQQQQQQPPAQTQGQTQGQAQAQQPAQQPAQPAARKFTAPAGLSFNIIKPDKTADFEKFIAKLHQALYQSTDAKRKQQATGWKVYKMSEPAPNGNVMYVYVIDPTVTDADYSIGPILTEGLKDQAAAAYELIKDAYVGQSLANLTLIADFSKPPAPTPAPGGQQ
jgi:hypothetical protein